MAKTFQLTVARVGETLFAGEARSVTLPGKDGTFTVLAGHEPFVSTPREGEATIEDGEGKSHALAITEGGIAEISGNQATVLL